MGNQKQKWTAEEEDALQRGVQKHGAGKWKNILKDPEFASSLVNRSNIDLKDKWRNLNVCPGQSSKDKSRTPKINKAIVPAPENATAAPAPPPVATLQNVTPPPQTQHDDDAKVPSRYNAMIYEALSTIKDANGSDINAIVNFIEQKHPVSQYPHFRRALATKLRRLVSQGKLEKVQNCYKIKKDTPIGTKSPDPKSPAPKETEQSTPGPFGLWTYEEAMKDAADAAAYSIADAENKAFLAAEAVKELERITRMSEHNDVVLKLVEEFCSSL